MGGYTRLKFCVPVVVLACSYGAQVESYEQKRSKISRHCPFRLFVSVGLIGWLAVVCLLKEFWICILYCKYIYCINLINILTITRENMDMIPGNGIPYRESMQIEFSNSLCGWFKVTVLRVPYTITEYHATSRILSF